MNKTEETLRNLIDLHEDMKQSYNDHAEISPDFREIIQDLDDKGWNDLFKEAECSTYQECLRKNRDSEFDVHILDCTTVGGELAPTSAEPDIVYISLTFKKENTLGAARFIDYTFIYYDCTDCCNAIESMKLANGFKDDTYQILFRIKPSYHS